MPYLTIVADIIAKAHVFEEIKNELEKLVPLTLAEEGCVNYDLHQNNENPAHFLIHENWETRELWLRHMESAHLNRFKAISEGKLAGFAIYEMTLLRSLSADFPVGQKRFGPPPATDFLNAQKRGPTPIIQNCLRPSGPPSSSCCQHQRIQR
jgi:quinol monooxygenase YgiN